MNHKLLQYLVLYFNGDPGLFGIMLWQVVLLFVYVTSNHKFSCTLLQDFSGVYWCIPFPPWF